MGNFHSHNIIIAVTKNICIHQVLKSTIWLAIENSMKLIYKIKRVSAIFIKFVVETCGFHLKEGEEDQYGEEEEQEVTTSQDEIKEQEDAQKRHSHMTRSKLVHNEIEKP